MLTRLVFLLLLVANIGVAAWLFLAPPPPPVAPPRTEPGVAPIVLLSETEEPPSAELAAAPEPADAGGERCVSIGPFPTQSDLRRALNALTPWVKRIQFRETRVRQTRGWSVFLPAPATRDEALVVARRLNARGVRDFYVVTAGAQQNTISLGLFRERDNAERRRTEIAALGFAPVMNERAEELPAYWLDYALASASSFDWRARLPEWVEIQQTEIRCF